MASHLSVEIETWSNDTIDIPMSGHMWDAYHQWKKSNDHADFDYLCDMIHDRVASRISFNIIGAIVNE